MSLGGYKLRPLIEAPRDERIPGAAAPGATTGTLAPVPAAMFPGGPTDLSFLYAQLQQAAFFGTAQTWTQTQTFNTAPNPNVSYDGRYTWSTDNTGTPGHSTSGPNLYLTRVVDGWIPLTMRSIGELAIDLKDASLPNTGVQHSIQLRYTVIGTPQVGTGTGVQMFCSDAGGTLREIGNVDAWLTATTAGAVSSTVAILTWNAGVGSYVVAFNPDGGIQAAYATGYFTDPQAPAATSAHGNFNSGVAGFSGPAGGTHFSSNNAAGDYSRDHCNYQVGGISVARISAPGQYILEYQDTANGSVSFGLRLGHQLSSGSPAVGFGSGLQIMGRDTGNTELEIGHVRAYSTAATPGSVTSNLVFSHIAAGVNTDSALITDAGDWKSLFKLLAVGGLGVGNSASASTLGSVVKKMQVFDASGNSLGYVPIYNSIT